jgi:coenzyme F420 hydrogenase subunit beta
MQLPVLNTIDDVVARQLCCGCGVCAAVDDRLEMIDALDHGRRPRVRAGVTPPGPGSDALRVCPGVGIAHDDDHGPRPERIETLRAGWGPVLEVWEGHARDDAVRFAASSGGAATAIALSCMEAEGMHGTLHIRARPDAPLLNETVLSTTRDAMLRATGSRYAPASPGDGLGLVERAPAPCVFIGKPCDVAAVHAARRVRPALAGRIGLTIAIFCAGTPTTRATRRLLEHLGVDDPSDVIDVRYRGNGWPGRTVVTMRRGGGRVETRSLSYEEAWGGILTHDKAWRCHVCADHTGELADISVGDPWHRPIEPGDPGRSLVLVRTERGRRLLRSIRARGDLVLEPADPAIVGRAQPALLRARGAVWGRLAACRLLGVPAPRYHGFPMLRFWLTRLGVRGQMRSLLGTVRRIVRRGLRRPVAIEPVMTGVDDAAAAPPAAPAAGDARRKAA